MIGGAGDERHVVHRAFSVLEAFKQRPAMTLTELVRRTGLPKTTVHRLASDLVDVGALERADGRYRIGLGLLELGTLHYDARMREVVFPYLDDLRQITGAAVHLSVLSDGEVVYVEHLSGRDTHSIRAGGRLPAHATASGRLLLAHASPAERDAVLRADLPALTARTMVDHDRLRDEFAAIVQRGYAVDDGGVLDGYHSVAVPVRNRFGNVGAALTVVGPRANVDPVQAVPAAQAIARILHRIALARGAICVV